ncbi:hypothetical protein AC99_1959 [Escherichia coli 2-222-05_S4_C2]|nr:hypothetical protein AC99_1959 [Escherichia coli 2-222-05_S4_C2]
MQTFFSRPVRAFFCRKDTVTNKIVIMAIKTRETFSAIAITN